MKKNVEAILATLDPQKRAEIEKALAASRSRRKDSEELEGKHSHMVKGSLGFDEVAKKATAEIVCTQPGCGKIRKVFTSDLFQVKVCEEHRKEGRKAARVARREEGKRALALLRSLETEAVQK